MQIIFAQNSDYAGLTGARFGESGGEEPTPEPEPTPGDGDFSSDSLFTSAADAANKAYYEDQNATINGESCKVIKLGTSSVVGSLTTDAVGVTGDKTLSFYGVAWKGKSGKLAISVDGTEVTTLELKSNDGATGNPPYTITFDESSDYYTVNLTGLSASSAITLSTVSGATRVILAGVKLQ
jgi:hypothetical protein